MPHYLLINMERRKLTQFYSRNNNDEVSSILSLSKAPGKHLTDVSVYALLVDE